MRLHPHLRVALAALATAAVWAPAAGADAATNSQTSFAPTTTGRSSRNFFQYTVKAGARLIDSAVLRNLTSRAQTYVLYAADAGDVNGAFAIANQRIRATGVGSWVTINAPHRLVLGAHDERTIRIRVSVPLNATPGDHAGGVVALALGTRPVVDRTNSLQMQAQYGVGIRIYVHVTGPLSPRAALTHVSLATSGGMLGSLIGRNTARISCQVSNSGNVNLRPSVDARVSAYGRSVRIPPQPLGELLPGSSTACAFVAGGWRWASLFGVMRAHVNVNAGDGTPPVHADVTVLTVPWLLITTLFLALVALRLLRRHHRRGDDTRHHRRRPPENPDPPAGALTLPKQQL